MDLQIQHNPHQIPDASLEKIDKLILKLMKHRGPRMAQRNLKEENKVGRLTFPNFKVYCYKAPVNKTVWDC